MIRLTDGHFVAVWCLCKSSWVFYWRL